MPVGCWRGTSARTSGRVMSTLGQAPPRLSRGPELCKHWCRTHAQGYRARCTSPQPARQALESLKQWHKTSPCRRSFVAQLGTSYNNADWTWAGRPGRLTFHSWSLTNHRPGSWGLCRHALCVLPARPNISPARARRAAPATRPRRGGARPPSTRAAVPGANPGAAPAPPRAPRPQRLRGRGGAGRGGGGAVGSGPRRRGNSPPESK